MEFIFTTTIVQKFIRTSTAMSRTLKTSSFINLPVALLVGSRALLERN